VPAEFAASSWSAADWSIFVGVENSPSNIHLFLRNQTCRAVHATKSISYVSNRRSSPSKMSKKILSSEGLFWIFLVQPCQASWAAGQLQSACPTVSISHLQMGHEGCDKVLRLYKFSFVGRILLHACHINIFTTLGPLRPQILLHILFDSLSFELPPNTGNPHP
jgi:hypothetical protein